MEVHVYKNPISFSCWSIRRQGLKKVFKLIDAGDEKDIKIKYRISPVLIDSLKSGERIHVLNGERYLFIDTDCYNIPNGFEKPKM